ncbi:MAG: hypothetical protein Q9182_005921 [Xanthomendoza sp. 2 TL-2023]
MSEQQYPFLEWLNAWPQREQAAANERAQREQDAANLRAQRLLQGPVNHQGTGVPNERLRHIILNSAALYCINGPPDVERSMMAQELSFGLDAEYVSVHVLVNKEIGNPKSPYIAAVQSTLHNWLIPDRMYVEILGKYLESRILRGQTRFLIDGMPRSRNQAAIVEEDVCSKSCEPCLKTAD